MTQPVMLGDPTFNLVAGPYSTTERLEEPDMNFWPASFALTLTCMAGLLLTIAISQNLGAAWGVSVLIGFAVLAFVGLPFAMVLRYRAIDDAFELKI